jgi:lipoprotein-anchoring transpeptidase ErfK/SrfK
VTEASRSRDGASATAAATSSRPASRRPTSPAGRWRRRWAAAVALLVAALGFVGTGYVYAPFAAPEPVALPRAALTPAALARQVARLEARQRQLKTKLARLAPRGLYIVIDQTHNRLYLRKDGEVLLEAVCSAGSGMVLKEGASGRTWVFDTPRGQFRVLSKIENPVWRKPDWAFVEEGEPIPTNAAERFEYGTLGEYALYFGNGYMIHGTLYERLLGRSVTHGCIRLGREDLRKVYALAPVGTPIFIY